MGEQPDTRHYDIADRDRDRTDLILTVTPIAQFDVNASVGTGRDNYKHTGFGLRDNKNNNWSVGFDVLPASTVNLGFNYGFEKYTAYQYSRTANPPTATDSTFYDPTRDWWDDQTDKVKTVSANLDFLRAIRNTDIRFAYDLSDGDATYVYGLKPEQKVFTTVPLSQLAPLKNTLTDFRADLTHYVRQNIALGVGYWYESYRVDDFALNSSTTGETRAHERHQRRIREHGVQRVSVSPVHRAHGIREDVVSCGSSSLSPSGALSSFRRDRRPVGRAWAPDVFFSQCARGPTPARSHLAAARLARAAGAADCTTKFLAI